MNIQKTLFHEIPSTINPIYLPPVSADDLPENQHPEIFVSTRIVRSLPALRDTLSSLKTRAVALVVDLFAPHAIDLAKEFGIPVYIFSSTAAYQLLMILDFTKFDFSSIPREMRCPPPAIMLRGSILVKQDDFTDLMKDTSIEVQEWFADLANKYLSADGIIVNSFPELESEAFKNLELNHRIPIYGVGPLIREEEADGDESECLKWLNDQPPKSVLFISFGSGTTLSIAQFRELAFGLEMSEQRFLWVVRSPLENASAAYLNAQNKKDRLDFLPERFLERTKGRGSVVASWAPQIRVLSHGSISGFMTHCGWNSILESVVFGVPLIAWPLCFEKKMNAVVLTDGLKVAIRVKMNEDGIVERDHISHVVKQLVEGEDGKQIRERMMDLKIAAGNALSQEGSSTKALAQIVQNWINGM